MYVSKFVQFDCLFFLNFSSLYHVPIILISIIGVVFVDMGCHGHDSTPTAEIVIVFDRNDATFTFVVIVRTSSTNISLFSPATGPWTFNKQHIDLKSLLVVKGFVAVQLTS